MEQLRFVARAAGANSSLLVEEAAQALSMFSRDPQALLVACKQLLTRQPTVGGLWWLCSRMLTATDPRTEARAIVSDLRSDSTGKTLAGALTAHAVDHRAADGMWTDGQSEGPRIVTPAWPDVVVAAMASSSSSALIIEVDGVGPGLVRRLERSDLEAETVAPERVAGAAAAADLAVVEAAAVGSATALVDVAGLTLAAVARAVGTPVWLVAPPQRVLPDPLWSNVVAARDRWTGAPWMAPSELVPVEMADTVISGDEVVTIPEHGDARSVVRSAWDPAPELIGMVPALPD